MKILILIAIIFYTGCMNPSSNSNIVLETQSDTINSFPETDMFKFKNLKHISYSIADSLINLIKAKPLSAKLKKEWICTIPELRDYNCDDIGSVFFSNNSNKQNQLYMLTADGNDLKAIILVSIGENQQLVDYKYMTESVPRVPVEDTISKLIYWGYSLETYLKESSFYTVKVKEYSRDFSDTTLLIHDKLTDYYKIDKEGKFVLTKRDSIRLK